MSDTITALLASIDKKIDGFTSDIKSLKLSFNTLANSRSEALKDDDEWTRFPKAKGRCPVTSATLSQIVRLTTDKLIRKKKRGEKAYFSAADWRKYMQD